MLKLTSLKIGQAKITYSMAIRNPKDAMCSKLHTSVRDYTNIGQPKCPKAFCHKLEKLNAFGLAGLIHKNFNDQNKTGQPRLSCYQISRLHQKEIHAHMCWMGMADLAWEEQKEIDLDFFCGVAYCLNSISACLQIRRHKNLIKEVTPLRGAMKPLARVA